MLKTKQKIRLARLVQVVVMAFRRILGLGPVTRCTRRGVAWELDLREGIDFSIWLLGSFEPETVACYGRIIRPGAVVLDVGANIGAHTLRLAQAAGPGGRVVAFEPTDYASGKLQRNCRLNPGLAGRITCRQDLLGEVDSAAAATTPLYSSWPLKEEADLHHLHQGRLMTTHGASVRTLDTAIAAMGLERVDCIKLDIDGAEVSFLRGARQVLTRWHPPIVMELAPYVLEEKGTNLRELVHLLKEYGYTFHDAGDGRALGMSADELDALIPPGASLNVVARAAAPTPAAPAPAPRSDGTARILLLACALVLCTYGLMIDLKGICVDEGFRLGIMNGGRPYSLFVPGTDATWSMVMSAIKPYAYQPGYFLLQNSIMRLGHTHQEVVLRLVNLFFLGLTLAGLVSLSAGWRLVPRLFLLGLFSFNAFLLMHVLQIREYAAGICFYVWSTWLVLHLDRRELGRRWRDLGWFAGYGVLLTAGFYTQTWVVFPAVGQGLFLVWRPAGRRLAFYAHLAVSYLIVIGLSLPYLLSHRQKVDIGRWGDSAARLWPMLWDGIAAVFSGHLAGQHAFSDVAWVFWLVVLAGAAFLFSRRSLRPVLPAERAETGRQASLMLLCLGVLLAFQVGYFLKVDTLALWTRYFAIHYFFLVWLVALAFKWVHDLGAEPAVPAALRGRLRIATGAMLAMLVASAAYQTTGYYRNPYVDTAMSAVSNWRTVAAALARETRPDDLVLTQDFLHMWSLSYSRPMTNPIVAVPQLESGVTDATPRVVYLEASATEAWRPDVTARLQARGFTLVRNAGLPTADGRGEIPLWRVLVFERK